MPQMRFQVRWPDESLTWCYSPSQIIKEYFVIGQSYPLAEFVARSRESLNIASERVKAKYGFYCTASADTLEGILHRAAEFERSPGSAVKIETFEE